MSHDPGDKAAPVLSWHVSPQGLQIWRGGTMLARIDARNFPALVRDMAKVMADQMEAKDEKMGRA
jgi:hypothetical protein